MDMAEDRTILRPSAFRYSGPKYAAKTAEEV